MYAQASINQYFISIGVSVLVVAEAIGGGLCMGLCAKVGSWNI